MIVCGSFGDCQHTDLGGFLFGNITALKPTEEPLVDFNAFAPFDCFIISALRTVENCECIVGGLVPKSLCSTEGHHETTISGYAIGNNTLNSGAFHGCSNIVGRLHYGGVN